MQIATPKPEFISLARAITELEQLLQAIQQPLEQPCPNCQHPESVGDPKLCQWRCPAAPQALSTEPETHPIEPHVLRVTFELSKLGLFQPCWSCEGHLDNQGNIYRLPQINFFCANAVYALMLHEHVDLLHHGGHLHARWQIALTSLGQKLGVVYVLQPTVAKDNDAKLNELQDDLHVIGADLARHLKVISEARLASLKMEQATLAAYHGQRL